MRARLTDHFEPRRRWRRLALIGSLVAAVMAFGIVSAFGVLTGSPSKFESNDGNMVLDGNNTFNDWATVDGQCTATTASCTSTSTSYVHLADSTSQSDDSFDPGQKQDTVCPDVTGHGNPNKDDFTDIASYTETQSATPFHTFFYGATIRAAANGNASENVELKQGGNGFCQIPGPNGTTVDGPLLARTAGDRLIAIDYLGGGANVEFHVLTWIASSAGFDPTPGSPNSGDEVAGTCFVGNDSPPCWSSTVKTLTDSAAEGSTNTSAISGTNNTISGQSLVANKFAEFGVDLVAAGIIPPNTCVSFPQTVWESRSSGSSFVSSTKDISVENKAISNCGSIKIIKQTNPRGIDQKFGFTSNLPANSLAGGVACTVGGSSGVAAGGAFCLNDSGNTGKTPGSTTTANNSAGNTVTETNLFPGSYNVAEDAPASGFAYGSIACTGGAAGAITVDNVLRKVTINLAFNDTVVCVYTNDQQLGAINVTKTAKSASCSGATPPSDCSAGKRPLAGAGFEIWQETNSTTGLQRAAVGATPADTKVANEQLTTADGTRCFGGLQFGTYYAHESTVPTGYSVPANQQDQSATISANSTCAGTPLQIGVENTPLTDVTVDAISEVTGGTASRISCVDGNAAQVGDSPDPNDVSGVHQFAAHATVTANGLKPGTYTCTVEIDP